MPKKIFRFVLTGGPCAGKTTALSTINNVFTQRGYRVLIIPESATELIVSGVHPWDTSQKAIFDFEYAITLKQIKKEELYEKTIISNIPNDKILLIYDRGIMDAAAFLPEKDFDEILSRECMTKAEIMSRYDAVSYTHLTLPTKA